MRAAKVVRKRLLRAGAHFLNRALMLESPKKAFFGVMVAHRWGWVPEAAFSKDIDWRFLVYLAQYFDISRSQLFQDLFVSYVLEQKSNGFFVEFGAADGVYLSNTYLLEKEFGWSGILAEPAPQWHDALSRNRRATIVTSCVHSVTGRTVRLAVPKEGAEYASCSENLEGLRHREKFGSAEFFDVETISLNDLLEKYEAPEVIDYISVDTEGTEYEIVKSFDFSNRLVKVWTIEHNYEPKQIRIDQLMKKNGYVRVFKNFSRFDAWYVHKSIPLASKIFE